MTVDSKKINLEKTFLKKLKKITPQIQCGLVA